MTYKVLVTVADAESEDSQTLAFAAELASVFTAVVRVAPAPLAVTADMAVLGPAFIGAFPAQVSRPPSRAADAQIDHIEQACRKAARTYGLEFGPGVGLPRMVLLEPQTTPWLTLSRQIAVCDLVVLGQRYLNSAIQIPGLLDDLLLRLRAPVFVARGNPRRLVGVAAIAWDGSLEAGRAVRASLPLLRRAGRVVILQSQTGLEHVELDPDPKALVDYLGLHGVLRADIHTAATDDAASSLLRMAAEERADLLIAGAYRRAKLVQRLLGGVTRALLETPGGPSLLLSH